MQRHLKHKDNGKTFKEKLDDCKRLTLAGVFLAGSVKLGQCVFNRVQEAKEQKKKEENEKILKAKKAYDDNKKKADAILALKLPIEDLKNPQIEIILKSLKQSHADDAIPSKKSDMIAKYHEWKNRPDPVFLVDDSVAVDDNAIIESINAAAVDFKSTAV